MHLNAAEYKYKVELEEHGNSQSKFKLKLHYIYSLNVLCTTDFTGLRTSVNGWAQIILEQEAENSAYFYKAINNPF